MADDPLAAVQRGLEALYRVETGVAVRDFMIDDATRTQLSPARQPREQLLVHTDADDELAVALYVCPTAVANLAAHSPADVVHAALGDLLLAIEGVSHFVYTVRCAQQTRYVSALELEMQAEVDKYATVLLATEATAEASAYWRTRLFCDFAYEDNLDSEEVGRYQTANAHALQYTGFLERAFVAMGRIPEMLAELRRYYRLGMQGKFAAGRQR